MLLKKREIEGSVVVITGASSGIGRATARRLAGRDADVVFAARSERDLAEAREERGRAGGRALAKPTDVGDERNVQALADSALEYFGRIDAWVNNAGVIAYGGFEDMPSEAFERVIRTNLFGQIYGARAALRAFRRHDSGVLVNVSSIWGRITSPYVGAYVVSKHGVRAFSECLRQGLKSTPGGEDIHVCTILPESIDTPIFRHAANYVGRPVKPVPPVEDPHTVANVIVSCIERPRLEVTVGAAGHLLEWITAGLPPSLYNRITPWLFDRMVLGSGSAEQDPGNLFAPEPGLNGVDGGWRDHSPDRLRRWVAAAALLAIPIATAGIATRKALLH
jgi:NAD(P)-dependent dehydrogenase (short-subunit alcohol dehydrogenase family)